MSLNVTFFFFFLIYIYWLTINFVTIWYFFVTKKFFSLKFVTIVTFCCSDLTITNSSKFILWMYPIFLEKLRSVLWRKKLRFVKKLDLFLCRLKKKRFVKKNQICFYIDKKLDLLKKKISNLFLFIKKIKILSRKNQICFEQ